VLYQRLKAAFYYSALPEPIQTVKPFNTETFGGAKRDRTADLLHAMQALSQLSYSPVSNDMDKPDLGDRRVLQAL
jgi:hypothetical protein